MQTACFNDQSDQLDMQTSCFNDQSDQLDMQTACFNDPDLRNLSSNSIDSPVNSMSMNIVNRASMRCPLASLCEENNCRWESEN